MSSKGNGAAIPGKDVRDAVEENNMQITPCRPLVDLDAMSAVLEFTVPGTPVPKQRARWGAGGRFYTPGATRAYEQGVGVAAMVARLRARWPKADAESVFAVEVDVVLPDERTRDVDNVAKSVLDAMNRNVWRDDRQVARLVVNRRVDRERPHTRVSITRVEQVPGKGATQ